MTKDHDFEPLRDVCLGCGKTKRHVFEVGDTGCEGVAQYRTYIINGNIRMSVPINPNWQFAAKPDVQSQGS